MLEQNWGCSMVFEWAHSMAQMTVVMKVSLLEQNWVCLMVFV